MRRVLLRHVAWRGRRCQHSSLQRRHSEDGGRGMTTQRPNNALSLGAAAEGTKRNLCTAATSLFATCALAAVHYVDVNSSTPIAPYVSWATAATNIQDAVDASSTGDEVVVTNGLYSAGGRAVLGTMTNRVAVDRP